MDEIQPQPANIWQKASLLRGQFGETEALRLALQEQRKARRARSRSRYRFWTAVAAKISDEDRISDEETRPDRTGGIAENRGNA
jgi:hypothetical protein